MGTSRAEKVESRERILNVAARQMRENGIESISIGALMKAAGLTHGAFYAHFPSRAALIATALDRALGEGTMRSSRARGKIGSDGVKAFVSAYLSQAHRDFPGSGCAVAALSSEAGRGDKIVQRVMRDQVEKFIEELALLMGGPPDARRRAMAAWASMVGAVSLSRLFPEEPIADEILDAARQSILAAL